MAARAFILYGLKHRKIITAGMHIVTISRKYSFNVVILSLQSAQNNPSGIAYTSLLSCYLVHVFVFLYFT